MTPQERVALRASCMARCSRLHAPATRPCVDCAWATPADREADYLQAKAEALEAELGPELSAAARRAADAYLHGPEAVADRLWWCVITDGEVWSRHRTQEAAIRASEKLDREFCGITMGMPPVLARNAKVGDFGSELDIVEEGDRSGVVRARGVAMTRPDLDDCGCLIIRCDCGRRLGTDDAPPSRGSTG